MGNIGLALALPGLAAIPIKLGLYIMYISVYVSLCVEFTVVAATITGAKSTIVIEIPATFLGL